MTATDASTRYDVDARRARPRSSRASRATGVDQVWDGLYEQLADARRADHACRKALRAALADGAAARRSTPVDRSTSDGGETVKWLWRARRRRARSRPC